MARRWLVTSVVLTVMLLTAGVLAQGTSPQHIFMSHDERSNGLGFGKNIAGAWLAAGSFEVDLGCDGSFDIGPVPFQDSHVFGINGDHIVVNPGNPNSNLSSWTKTGQRQLTSTGISFAVDMTPGGTLTTVAVITTVIDFDPGFQTATTTFAANVFLPHQDPLDPAELPVACTMGRHTSFRKVNVQN